MNVSHRRFRRQARAGALCLAVAVICAFGQAWAQPGGETRDPSVEVTPEDRDAAIERLTFEVRQAMSSRRWSAAVQASDQLLGLDPDNSTARVQKEQAERQIALGVPEGNPTPTPSPTPEPTPAISTIDQQSTGEGEDPAAPTRQHTSQGTTPMELIYGAIAAAVILLGAIWFFFFARKKPAERRTPTPSVVPVIPKPISPYGKAKTSEPAKDENLIQYGSVGQLNKTVEEPAAAKPSTPATKPKEDPPTHRDPPVAAAPILAAATAAVSTPHSDISTHDEAEPEFTPVPLTEPAAPIAGSEPPRPSLPEPVERPLPVVRLNLGALEETPAAAKASEPGPDLELLPRIQLMDAPLTSPSAPVNMPEVVGSDLPAISFDADVPLDLGPEQSVPESMELPDDIMPGIKLAEETLHLGGADDVGLNDLPDVAGSLGSKGGGASTIRLVDTPLEALPPSKAEVAAKPHADVPTIKLVE